MIQAPKSFEPFSIGTVPVGGPVPFFILGPCAMESEEFTWEMARAV
jgi:2-dehydro-3-deoxyphosphooctonate aldolase (KDO 8-P synthase)